MKISAIVVTHNRLNLLKECLNHLLIQTYLINKIFIVNNNSKDGTKEYLQNLNNKNIIVINVNKNIGGAGGFNKGIKFAYIHSSSDYFWLMDDDTMPTNNSLETLINFSKKINNNFGFLCSNVRWWKDNHAVNLPDVSTKDWNELLPNFNAIKVVNATFVSFLVKRSVITKLGLPISDMFISGDDTEYSTRISNHFNSYFVSNSIVIHKSVIGNRINETIYNTDRLKYYNCMYKNNLFIIKKYYGYKKFIKQLLHYISTFIAIPFISKNKKIKRAFCILDGIFKGILFNPKVEYLNNSY